MASAQILHRTVSSLRQNILNFRSIHISSTTMVKVGDKIPAVELQEDNPGNKVAIADLVKGKKAIIFGVPGAFTPGCSKTHLPGYIAQRDALKQKGVDEVICVAVNDAFVMAAWGKEQKADGKVRMLADPEAKFAKALEVDIELAVLGGTRSKRYAMVLEDGVITQLSVEPDGTGLSCSLVEQLKI